MKDIINLNDQQYEIESSNPLTLEQKNKILQQMSEKGTSIGCTNCSSTKTLNPASCVSSVVQGSTRPIIITTGNGIAPYFYTLVIDGTNKVGHINVQMTSNTVTFNYTFNESVGSHTFGAFVKDSCSTPMTSSTDTCTINITASCIVPTCSFTIV